MRAATSLALMALGVIGISAVPTSGAERATPFSFRGPVIVQRQAEARNPGAEHRFVRRKPHHIVPLALVPFGTWDDEAAAVPLPAPPAAPAELAAPAPTPPVQLPACRETVAGVTIMRGQACRA